MYVTPSSGCRTPDVRTTTFLAFLSLMPIASACGDDASDDGNATSDTNSTSGNTTMVLDAGDAPEPTTSPVTTATDTGLDSGSTSPDDETTAMGSSGDATTGGTQSLPPTNSAELVPWLEAGEYLDWDAESAPHPSAGPHGTVRTFFNDVLTASFEAGASEHPQDAATVKELYDAGGSLDGWAVMVKVQADSAGGDGWYWYEVIGASVFADGTGVALCTGCHSGGGTDYVLSPYPLQ